MAHLTNRTKFFIGTTSAADTLTEFEADSYVEIKPVFDLGEFGDVYEAVEDKTITFDRVTRFKGSVDGGTIELIVNREAADPGQIALAAAAKNDGYESEGNYNFKMVLPDKPTAAGIGTTIYFRAVVMGGRTSFGEADNIVRTTWTLGVNTEWLEVEPDAGP